MTKIYKAYRDGYITIGGQSVEVKIGQIVKESVYNNYPNFFAPVEIESPVTEPVEVPVVEEPQEPTDATAADETSTEPVTEEPKKKRK
jgi:hypothetical protein